MPNVDTEHFPHDAVRRTQFMINPCLSVYDHLQYGVLSMGCAFALRTPSQALTQETLSRQTLVPVAARLADWLTHWFTLR